MKIIDVHVHLLKWMPEVGFCPILTFNQTITDLHQDLIIGNVSHTILIPTYKEDNERDISFEALLNLTSDDLPPSRFSILGSIQVTGEPIQFEKGMKLLRENFASNRIVGVKICLGYEYIFPFDKRLEPIYKLCTIYDRPVVFHTGITLNEDRPARLEFAHPLHLDRVAFEHPELKIIMAHCGAPWFDSAMAVLSKNKNVFADISGMTEDNCLDGPYGQWVVDRIQGVMDYCSPTKFLYGTDYPLARQAVYQKFAKRLRMTKDEEEYFYYKNAKELFGLTWV